MHYVPSGYNGIEEIERIVQFLRANDDMAKAIGQNSQRFAREHLNEEARHCYLKVNGDGGSFCRTSLQG